jgi:selenide,water dikinase
VTTTALKREQATAEDIFDAIGWMTRLNDKAGKLAVSASLQGGTDVTGYSLLGHGWEMAQSSSVGLRLTYNRIPFLAGARQYAEAGAFPGGAFDNKAYFAEHVSFSAHVDELSQMLLFDPQTSGGLLLSVPPEKLPALLEQAANLDQPMWEIGEVIPESGIWVV